ncbi:MAG TPA: hypothetical protein VNJ07_06520 [Chitinophagales bacterium]|nr:hypothetical protein [Chitinophagales bacterium]
MAVPLGKKADVEKIVELYLSRFKGQPDATRLLLNMLADKVTDINVLRNHVIKDEFKRNTSKPKADKTVIIQRLSEAYGLTRKQIIEIVEG